MTERLSGHTLMYGILATPIRHSLSPQMYNESYAKLGLDNAYLAFEVGPDQLEEAIKGVRALGIRGLNISMPNKRAILPLLDDLSPAARMIGAVNTVTNEDGKGYLVGHNTDGSGALRSLEAEGVTIKDQVVTLAGVGGAGTAIAVQAAIDGAKEIRLFNIKDTSFEEAHVWMDQVSEQTDCVLTLEDLEDQDRFYQSIRESSIYIDATGIGMEPFEDQKLINDASVIRPDLAILDVVYNPKETELLRFARENGCKVAINGLGMLLYQGVEAFKLHTGYDMPVDYVKKTVFTELDT